MKIAITTLTEDFGAKFTAFIDKTIAESHALPNDLRLEYEHELSCEKCLNNEFRNYWHGVGNEELLKAIDTPDELLIAKTQIEVLDAREHQDGIRVALKDGRIMDISDVPNIIAASGGEAIGERPKSPTDIIDKILADSPFGFGDAARGRGTIRVCKWVA